MHDVDIEEIYEVFEHRFIFTRRKRNRYQVIGKTIPGRFLTIYLDKVRNDYEIVTARDSDDSEKRFYKKET